MATHAPSSSSYSPLKVSVIVPALNEAGCIERSILSAKRRVRCAGTSVEVIVVDGGSSDDTVGRSRALGARVIRSARGRGTQQDEGSKVARGDFFFFLHADTQLPDGYDSLLLASLDGANGRRQAAPSSPKHLWGAFSGLAIEGLRSRPVMEKLIEFGVAQRTRLLHLPYGDQCLFFHREAYAASGGYAHTPFMEDYALVQVGHTHTHSLSPLLSLSLPPFSL